jgi:hypothetical protein
MNRFIPTSRTGKAVFGLAAAAITGLAVAGGAAAANAAPAPAPKPAAVTTGGAPVLVPVDCVPVLAETPGGVHSIPQKPQITDGTDGPVLVPADCADEPGLVEVPGAKPDFTKVLPGQATAVDAVPEVIGD